MNRHEITALENSNYSMKKLRPLQSLYLGLHKNISLLGLVQYDGAKLRLLQTVFRLIYLR